MSDRLPLLLAALGKRLPSERITTLQQQLRQADDPADEGFHRWATAQQAAGLAFQLTEMRIAWQQEAPGLPGSALALSLGAVAASRKDTEGEATELVVSGPTSPALPVRLTSSVAVDVIRSAQEALVIASFAAFGIHEIVAELRAAAARGVHIDLLLEESTSAARAFGSLGSRVRVWHPTDPSARRSLHAKVVAADRHTALLGSANLTGRALRDNIEVGVILHGSGAVGRLVDHLRWLTHPETGLLRAR
ncbi:DISARM system phospholipase D-like protein DrmC [Streptomyces sp. ID01-9D]|uniref:DISARM system phospholipase D-like protein DrmC n=1 Tax=Streptomyces sp. ID01-9D TaxID=3028659 RepID=UPI0029C49427|nr:DISARM system phospholipase D-like protein DrmC [Streptomyces sp. ID01-9D]MDX5576499.1 DISARM system phospholipase D-like protein DrmC [Streptomyces sp. ID01-9D]MDX5576504.1 DISARM system phospholipase D-like protein DrmC [Streptomyces sp. ID01-9D]